MSLTTRSPGTKTRHELVVPGTEVRMPYTVIEGTQSGPTVLVSGGVHGGEYPGIEAAIRTARDLDAATLHGRVVVIHMVNPPAFWGKMQYFNPLDGTNLNRVFPGDAEGSPSQRMAAAVIGLAREADYWIDLHGGDIHEALVPFTIFSDQGSDEVRAMSRAMAEAYGIGRLIESASVAGGSYAAAAALGIPAILPESGQVGQLDEESVRLHTRGVRNVLRRVGVLQEPVEVMPAAHHYSRFAWRRAPEAGLWYAGVQVGEMVEEGEMVGEMRDVYGDRIQAILAPGSGEVLFVATSLAIGSDDPLLAVASEA